MAFGGGSSIVEVCYKIADSVSVFTLGSVKVDVFVDVASPASMTPELILRTKNRDTVGVYPATSLIAAGGSLTVTWAPAEGKVSSGKEVVSIPEVELIAGDEVCIGGFLGTLATGRIEGVVISGREIEADTGVIEIARATPPGITV